MERPADSLHPEDPENAEDLRILARLIGEDGPPDDPEEDDEEELYVIDELEDEEPAAGGAAAPTLIAGRFEVRDVLPEGRLGSRYVVRDLENQGRLASVAVVDAPWADEVDDGELQERAEALLADAHRLTHDTLRRLREVGLAADGRVWLAADPVEGETARELIDRSGALPPRHAMEIVHQVLQGLAHGHFHGLAHGHLDAEHVTLAARVPWTEENPFAVGVRLTGYGYTRLLRRLEAQAEGSFAEECQRDLFDAGLLLVELLTGTRYQEDLSDWRGSESVPMTASLGPEGRAVLDRALHPDPSRRFANAVEFRGALEDVREFRPRRSRALARALLVATVLVIAAGAAVFATRDRWSGRIATKPALAGAPAPDPAAEEARRALESRVEALSEEVAESKGALAATIEERDALRTQVSSVSEERAALDRTLEEVQAEAQTLRGEAARAGELTEELERTRQRLAELEAAIPDPAERAEAVSAATDDIDALVRRLRAGDLQGARALTESLAEDAVLATTAVPVASFFSSLVEANDALAALEAEPDPFERRSELAAARPLFARLRTESELALSGTTGWDVMDSGQRIVTFRNLLAEAESRLEAEEARLREDFDALWLALLERPDRSPGEVGRLVEVLGPERWPDFVERYFGYVSERALGHDALRLDELARIESLPAWVEHLRAHPIPALEAETSALAVAHYALAFYRGDALPPRPEALDGVEPDGGWRERLALSSALLDPETGLRGPVGTRLLYYARSGSGEESWRWDTILEDPYAPTVADASRLVRQEFYDAQGIKRGEREVRVYSIGRRLFEEDSRSTELLDVSEGGDAYAIRSWKQTAAPAPPERLLVPPTALRDFRRGLERQPVRAYVVTGRGERNLWTREHGLVLHDTPGRITYELVFAERAE